MRHRRRSPTLNAFISRATSTAKLPSPRDECHGYKGSRYRDCIRYPIPEIAISGDDLQALNDFNEAAEHGQCDGNQNQIATRECGGGEDSEEEKRDKMIRLIPRNQMQGVLRRHHGADEGKNECCPEDELSDA
jgi:hypothetical protein